MPAVLVIGPGGVGQTTLLGALHKWKVSVNKVHDGTHEIDGPKHLAHPDLLDHRGKVIYCFGNPARAIYSHLRRGWARQQRKKLGKKGRQIDLTKNAGKNKDESFNDILDAQKKGQDVFGVVDHFFSWKEKCRNPILFVDFLEDPDGSWRAIAEFIGKNIGKAPKVNQSRARVGCTVWDNEISREVYIPLYMRMKESHMVSRTL